MQIGLKIGPGIGVKIGPGGAAAAAPMPTFVAAGAAFAGTGVLTPGMPAGIEAGDRLVLVVNNTFTILTAATLIDAEGFTAVPGGFIDSGSFGGIHALATVFDREYDGTGVAPAVADNGEYSVAQIFAFRGVGSYTSVAVDGDNDGGVTMTLGTAGSTVEPNSLVVSFVSGFTQASGEVLTDPPAWSGLDNITARVNASYALGEDVYLGCFTGEAPDAATAFDIMTTDWTGAGAYWVSSGVTIVMQP